MYGAQSVNDRSMILLIRSQSNIKMILKLYFQAE